MVLFRQPCDLSHGGKEFIWGIPLLSTVSVSKEVAEFLETDRKRQAAEGRSDHRHISKSDSETVLSTAQITAFSDPTFESAFKNLCFEKLQKIIADLEPHERFLIRCYFFEERTMQQIADKLGVSKMAISKQLKKLLSRIRKLMET